MSKKCQKLNYEKLTHFTVNEQRNNSHCYISYKEIEIISLLIYKYRILKKHFT